MTTADEVTLTNASVALAESEVEGTASQLSGRVRRLLFLVTLSIMLLTTLGLSVYALFAVERQVAPAIEERSLAISRSIAADIGRAVEAGVPYDQLQGMKAYLSEIRSAYPEIVFIIATDAQGKGLYLDGPRATEASGLIEQAAKAKSDPLATPDLGGDFHAVLPLRSENALLGALHMGVSRDYIVQTLADIVLDVGIVVLVALLLAFELLLFLISFAIAAPIEGLFGLMARGVAGRFDRGLATRTGGETGRVLTAFDGLIQSLNDRYAALVERADALRQKGDAVRTGIETTLSRLRKQVSFAERGRVQHTRTQTLAEVRTPMFLFVLAEELSRSFFPIYVRELYSPIPWLSQEMVIGLPISAFMLFVALATPLAGAWSDRVGSRRIFVLGVIPALAGFVGCAFATDIYELLIARILTAIGYAMVTIACQGHIVRITTDKNRTQGMAVFLAAIVVAAICGTSVGAVIADRIGYRDTFLVSALLAVIAAIFVFNAFPKGSAAQEGGATQTELKFRHFLSLFTNVRFTALILLAAIPAKLALTGFLFYLTPLYLDQFGMSQSGIGRFMMVYFIIMIFLAPFFASIADARGLRMEFTALGAIVSGLGALVVMLWEDNNAVLVAIIALGIGQAMSTSAMTAMVPEVAQREVMLLGRTTILAMLRVLERIGSVAGPFVMGAMTAALGYAGAVAGLGYFVTITGVLFLLLFLVQRRVDAARSQA